MDNLESDNCFVTQGLITSFVQQFNDRQKMSNDDDDKWNNSGEDDDIILNEASDDESKDAQNGNAAAILGMLLDIVEPIKKILQFDSSKDPIQTAFQSNRVMPLGKTKLRASELLCAIVSLKKSEIIKVVADSKVMQTALELIAKHPWNNMIQLQAH